MRILLSIVLTLFAGAALAKGWGEFDYEFENEKPWVELEHQLPAYPKQENLLPLYVSAATDNLFYIDAPSIVLGEDGVVRYTLVVKSSLGALNVSFEGMRCATREKRIYAFGRADGRWSKARFAKWEPIRYADRNRQHHMLYDDFFCPNGLPASSAEAMVEALKRAANLVK